MDQIPTAGVHDKIAGGNWFGGLGWSPDESKVVYVAQKKAAETRSGLFIDGNGVCVACGRRDEAWRGVSLCVNRLIQKRRLALGMYV